MNLTNSTIGEICIGGYKLISLGVPTPLALILTIPVSVIGTVLNAFALAALCRQKQFSNQDFYVAALCISCMTMAGPCLFLFIYGNVKICYDFAQIVSDIRIFLVQVSAGISIWLVVLISFDRLMMIYFGVRYLKKVTKSATICAITFVIIYYICVCVCVDFSPYFMGTYIIKPLSYHPGFVMNAQFLEAPTVLSYSLNMLRMVTDRMLPWILCTANYVAIFFVRKKQKSRVIKPTISCTIEVTMKISRPETSFFHVSPNSKNSLANITTRYNERVRRGRNLVIGITLSLLVCLIPETIFDISSYVFRHPLRVGVWQIFGVVWYFQTIVNPIIYIFSMRSLRATAWKLVEKFTDAIIGVCHKTKVMNIA